MEAEGLLAAGFRTRLAIQSKPRGWVPLRDVARTWLPPRLKGVEVGRDFGTGFLTAGQVFDLRPIPRKWLSLEQTDAASQRFVAPRTILVTRSGTVGRATLARDSLRDVVISDDLLRVDPKSDKHWGWLYAYLRAPLVIGMMQSLHYGHVVKHLQPTHLDDVPILEIDENSRVEFDRRVRTVLDRRNRAEKYLKRAEELLSDALHVPSIARKSSHSIVKSRDLASGRRRMEGTFHTEKVRLLLNRIAAHTVDPLKEVSERVWWMTRFSRSFGDSGVPYRSADELFSIGQVSDKRVHLDPIERPKDFFVKDGWILMACSGQVYGLNGSVTLATRRDESYFFSHDLIRIVPRSEAIRPGYLFAYLGHPDVGRVLLKRAAYGSSVPHIDPGDVEDLPIARLSRSKENQIADLAAKASQSSAEATEAEQQLARKANDLVESFLG